MPVFESVADLTSDAAQKSRDEHLALLAEVREFEAKVCANSERAREKFEGRGQLLPRDRLDLLLDRGAPFLQISSLCGLNMHDDDGDKNASGGGGIAGIGWVGGVRAMIGVSDSGIKGGAATPMGMQRGLRCQEIALRQKLPYIQLVESAGANLFRQADMFVPGGRSFANEAKLSAAGIPVVSVVHGSSTAGGAYQPGMSDYVIVVRGKSKIFLGGPPLVKAATGEDATDEELGGAEMHSTITGLGEWMAEDDRDAIRQARELMASLNWNERQTFPARTDYDEPLYDADELLSLVPTDYRKPYDVREVIARIVDGSVFLDYKAEYGAHTVCGLAAIEGYRIGIIGNNGPIDPDGSVKAGQFIQSCNQSGTPLLFLQNTTGYIVGKDAETRGIVKHGSKMIQAVTNATVPKITMHIGASFGAGNYGMCGRAYDPDFIFAWPNNRIAVMGGEQAATVMRLVAEGSAKRRGQEPDAKALDAMFQQVVDTYDAESRALFATARLWDDGIIDPRDTRRIVANCLSICQEAEHRKLRPSTFAVARG